MENVEGDWGIESKNYFMKEVVGTKRVPSVCRKPGLYSQVPKTRPTLSIILSTFFQPPDLIRTPPFNNFKEIDFFTNPSLHFLSFLVLFTPTI